MGQYYKVVIDEKDTYDRSVDGEYTMAKIMEHSWWKNPFVCSLTGLLYDSKHKVAWIGDYSEDENEKLYNIAWNKKDDENISIHESMIDLHEKYLINHDKKEFIDCSKYYKNSVTEEGWCIHPLPLLTAIGNGKGGGDYYQEIGQEYIGTWANDTLEVKKQKPLDYTEIFPIFKEF